MATVTVTRGAPASAPPRPDAIVDRQGLDETVGSVHAARERWARTSVPEGLASQAWAYQEPRPEPVVELVLGAGNIASLAPRDVLYSMFVENRVAVLKCNPVNDYLAPHLEHAFAALIEHGVLRIVKGDAA